MTSFSHHPIGNSKQAIVFDNVAQSFRQNEPWLIGPIAQNQNSDTLENALEPKFTTEKPSSEVVWFYAKPYVGPMLLSLLLLAFLILLLRQRRFKEASLAGFATSLLGVAFPIWLIVKLTLGYLGVEEPHTSNPPPSESIPPTSADLPESADLQSEPSLEEETKPAPVVALGLGNLNLDFEFGLSPDWLTVLDSDVLNPLEDEGNQPTITVDAGTSATITAWNAANAAIAETWGSSPNQSTPNPSTVSSTSAPSYSITTTINGGAGGAAPIPPRLSAVNFDVPIPFRSILRQGLSGQDVIVLQKLLKDLGFYETEPDGYFGLQTTIAVQTFQKQHNLLDDGIVGFSTCEILNAQTSEITLRCRE
ncbi:MAG: peptidoglycan-binding protein [Spirulina sp. SIO3F2]|nr:peptidoglycan-binding protein [Spirulina sp. SIO3F2]